MFPLNLCFATKAEIISFCLTEIYYFVLPYRSNVEERAHSLWNSSNQSRLSIKMLTPLPPEKQSRQFHSFGIRISKAPDTDLILRNLNLKIKCHPQNCSLFSFMVLNRYIRILTVVKSWDRPRNTDLFIDPLFLSLSSEANLVFSTAYYDKTTQNEIFRNGDIREWLEPEKV